MSQACPEHEQDDSNAGYCPWCQLEEEYYQHSRTLLRVQNLRDRVYQLRRELREVTARHIADLEVADKMLTQLQEEKTP